MAKARTTMNTMDAAVHHAMKQPSRRIYGKVAITYTDPMLAVEEYVETSPMAYNSELKQLTDTITTATRLKYFTLYDNDLTGTYVVSDAYEQLGWVSGELSDENGYFENPPYFTLRFSARPVTSAILAFDNSRGNLVEEFFVSFVDINGFRTQIEVHNNTNELVELIQGTPLVDIVSMRVTINKISKPNSPAIVLDVPMSSTILYKGYENESELISINLLEELTYEDDIETLGGVSANEVTVVLDNSSRDFFFNSNSPVSNQLRRNRKIVPWLGVELDSGEIEWRSLGTFWSHEWDVPAEGLTAKVVGFDTIGLLSHTDFSEHQTQRFKSIGELIEYVLIDARRKLDFIEYSIDDALYSVVIPFAWFERGSHAAALRKISLSYPVHIYCDRNGRICAKPHELRVDGYHDEWSDDTNVIEKTYNSLYTTLPNVVSVTVCTPHLEPNKELARDDRTLTIQGTDTLVLSFNAPFVSDISLSVDYDPTITYTYEVFSWGIRITFNGYGVVRGIICYGTAVSVADKSVITRTNEESVRLDGTVTRDITSDFIQTLEQATDLLDRIFSLSEQDKYDVSVKYRGDIALSVGDPILLNGGLAPDNRYIIKRHQLNWNGSLTGSAELNT